MSSLRAVDMNGCLVRFITWSADIESNCYCSLENVILILHRLSSFRVCHSALDGSLRESEKCALEAWLSLEPKVATVRARVINRRARGPQLPYLFEYRLTLYSVNLLLENLGWPIIVAQDFTLSCSLFFNYNTETIGVNLRANKYGYIFGLLFVHIVLKKTTKL